MKFLFSTLLLAFSLLQVNAQILTPVKWSFFGEATEKTDEYVLHFRAAIDKNWTVYSQFTSDDGPVPTEIIFESEGFETLGKATEKGHKKQGTDKLFDVEVIKLLDDEDFVISQRVKVTDAKAISGYLTFMTCDNARCLPPTDIDFKFDLTSIKPQNVKTEEPVMMESSGSTDPVKPAKKTEQKATQKVEEKTTPKESKISLKKSTNTATPAGSSIKNQNVNEEKVVLNEKAPAIVMKTDDAKAANLNEQIEEPKKKILNPVKWSLDIVDLKDGTHELIYKADIQENWTVYSQFTNDDGPVPTEITYETENFTKVGESIETGHKKEGMDEIFEVNVIKYLDDEAFTIKQKVKFNDANDPIKGYLSFMTCDDSKCIMPTPVEFEFNASKLYAGPPVIAGGAVKKALDGNTLDQNIPSIAASVDNPPGDCGTEEASNSGLFWSFLFGFGGGLLALLTPCVFPMIPLTVSFFTKDTKRSGLTNGLIYGASIIVIYVALGLLLTAVFGDEALNKLSTDWIANTIFFLVFLFFAFSFFGYYEITLPSSWSNKSDAMADKGGLIGIFFMAATLAIVSFSCTGPIIGSAIVESADSKIGPAITMLGFSLALAIPFGLFAAFPSWLNSLPKSGGWMNSVKVVLGFAEVALAFKFLSVADLTSGWGVLRYEPFLLIWVLCALGITIYLLGGIKFPHDSPKVKFSATRIGFALLFGVATIYLASGFRYNPKTEAYRSLSLMSGLAPPAQYNFFLKDSELDANLAERFVSYTKCANNLDCFKDYYEGMSYAQEVNKPVLLDFTGHGCVNCRKTEEHIWIKDQVWNKLKNDFVLVSLYVDERKKLKEPYVSKERDVKLRTVGNLWADFQIINFAQNSQPLYVMMTPDGKVLANPRGYHPQWKEYVEFLDCGMDAFKK